MHDFLIQHGKQYLLAEVSAAGCHLPVGVAFSFLT
jgi:hypothetical protein